MYIATLLYIYKHQNNYTMAKFIQQEMSDLNNTGKKQTYYRMDVKRNINTREFIEKMTFHGSAMDKGKVIQVITEMSEYLSFLLADGYSVSIDGLGTFTASVGVDKWSKEDEMDTVETNRTAKTITVNGINFKADKQLIKETAIKCNLSRGGKSFLRHSPYTKEQRWQKAVEYLSDPAHPMMRLDDYVSLTGVSRPVASRELREYYNTPNCQISILGKGTGKVYVKKTETTEI